MHVAIGVYSVHTHTTDLRRGIHKLTIISNKLTSKLNNNRTHNNTALIYMIYTCATYTCHSPIYTYIHYLPTLQNKYTLELHSLRFIYIISTSRTKLGFSKETTPTPPLFTGLSNQCPPRIENIYHNHVNRNHIIQHINI